MGQTQTQRFRSTQVNQLCAICSKATRRQTTKCLPQEQSLRINRLRLSQNLNTKKGTSTNQRLSCSRKFPVRRQVHHLPARWPCKPLRTCFSRRQVTIFHLTHSNLTWARGQLQVDALSTAPYHQTRFLASTGRATTTQTSSSWRTAQGIRASHRQPSQIAPEASTAQRHLCSSCREVLCLPSPCSLSKMRQRHRSGRRRNKWPVTTLPAL